MYHVPIAGPFLCSIVFIPSRGLQSCNTAYNIIMLWLKLYPGWNYAITKNYPNNNMGFYFHLLGKFAYKIITY